MKNKTPVILEKPEGNTPAMYQKPTPATYYFASKPRVLGRGAIAGEKEKAGMLGAYIKDVMPDAKFGEKTFEKGENKMLQQAVALALENAGLSAEDVDLMLMGDLLNQITASTFAARTYGRPFLGLYNACSTMAESLLLGAALVDGGLVQTAVCATGSHFATAERQYRGPLELGAQRQQYAQRTVTGAAGTVVGRAAEGVAVTRGTVGKIVDFGINDVANMGAAMAPAACDTLLTLFEDTVTTPADYDMILTGDLGKLGSDILRELAAQKGYRLGKNYSDCGNMMYGIDQNVQQGGSGCGCGAIVLNTYVI
ncbi:MAG: stage V sporulation protein AD, partial [Firmicutes bacterium]|nr:stage V sporulation protein AD [Bacillota bacterium]